MHIHARHLFGSSFAASCTASCLLALGVLTAAWPGAARAQVVGTDITSITTITTNSIPGVLNDVRGDSEFEDRNFSLNFLGLVRPIVGFSTDSGPVTVNTIPAQVFVRRNPTTDNRQLGYYQGSLDLATNTFQFLSAGPLNEANLFALNTILAGGDNVFTNVGANLGGVAYNGNASIERLDFVLTLPVEAKIDIGFAVIERGAVAGHDGFGISAITAVDKSGNPTAYGPVYIVAANTWGRTALLQPIPQYYFVNNAEKDNRGVPINPALTIPSNQTLGGLFIRTTELVPAGQRVYGYSLFAPDVTCSPAALVNVANACFPTNTGTIGGIDLVAPNLGAVLLEAPR